MSRVQINAENSNEYSDAELDLISFPDSTHHCHFTLFSFSLIVVTQKNAKIRINSFANIDFMGKKNWQTYLLSPILPPELFIYAEKKSV